MVEDGGEVDCGRVTPDADGVDRARGRCDSNNHEAQRKRRKAPDQTQCQYSAMSFVPAKATGPAHAIDAMKAKEIKGFPPGRSFARVKQPTQFCQYVGWSPCGGVRRPPFPAGKCCPSRALSSPRAAAASPWPRWPRPSPPYPHSYGVAASSRCG